MELYKAIIAQKTFKAVMNAFAHPFRIYRLPEDESDFGERPALKMLAFTLLDGAATLYVHDDDALAEDLRETTYVRRAEIGQADFVILRDSSGSGLLSRVRSGDLINPQNGATVIIFAPELFGSVRVTAAGPGIDGEATFDASECVAEYLRAVSELAIEYPMGFELLFVTPHGELLAVPRHVNGEVG